MCELVNDCINRKNFNHFVLFFNRVEPSHSNFIKMEITLARLEWRFAAMTDMESEGLTKSNRYIMIKEEADKLLEWVNNLITEDYPNYWSA